MLWVGVDLGKNIAGNALAAAYKIVGRALSGRGDRSGHRHYGRKAIAGVVWKRNRQNLSLASGGEVAVRDLTTEVLAELPKRLEPWRLLQ